MLSADLMNTVKGKNGKYITLGAIETVSRVDGADTRYAALAKIEASCFRLYNRGLDPTEVHDNYEQTKFYHENVMGKELE